MRRLVFLSLGFGLACGLWAYALPGAWLAPGAVLAAALAVALSRLGGKRTALALLGCTLGLGWCLFYGWFWLDPPRKLDGTTGQGTIRISDHSQETDYGIRADGRLRLEGKWYAVRVYLDGDTPLEPGMEVTGEFRFRATIPGGEGESAYDSGKGICLLAYQTDAVTVKSGTESWLDLPARMRQWLRLAVEACFPEDTAAFAKALLLGDTEDLDYETDMALKISGIRHVVAVSGLHVSILFGALEAVTLRKRYLTALIGFPGLLLFAAVTGFSPSVDRACLMVGLMLLARLLEKEYDGPSALAFAALVILIGNPMTIVLVSFQLSVASVAGIYLFQPGLHRWLSGWIDRLGRKGRKNRLIRWSVSSVSVTLGAMALTTPLCAWYFGMVSLIGVVTNLLALWMVSGLFCGIGAACALYVLWPAGAGGLSWVLHWGIRYVLAMGKLLARVPLAAVYTSNPYIVIWLVFVYALLGAFLVSRNRHPGVLGACAGVGLCLALLCGQWELDLEQVRLTVLDVGQGQCILLQSQGRTFLVDCGGDSDAATANLAAQTLLGQNIRHLDGMILTHCDRDHAGGAEYFLSLIDTELLILPQTGGIDADVPTVYASQDLELTFGNTVLRVFAPTYPGSSNETSLCVLFDTEKCDILITGDRSGFGERSLLRNENIGTVDVLVAGHHGSKNATCQELLEAVQPDIVCISVGKDNTYGHPAQQTLERLEAFGCTVYRTDLQGTITIRR